MLTTSTIMAKTAPSSTVRTKAPQTSHVSQNVKAGMLSEVFSPRMMLICSSAMSPSTNLGGVVPSITAAAHPSPSFLPACRIHSSALSLSLTDGGVDVPFGLPHSLAGNRRLMPKSALEGEKEEGRERGREGRGRHCLLPLFERARLAFAPLANVGPSRRPGLGARRVLVVRYCASQIRVQPAKMNSICGVVV